MDSDPTLPSRRHPVHFTPTEFGNRSTIVFLTLCVANRHPLLARPETARLIVESWSQATHWLVGRYVLLPDHLHLFCAPGIFPAHPLKQWVRYWQTLASRAWPHSSEKPIWQKDFWDRQLRHGDSYGAKWEYVRNNPVRHKLVAEAADWPFQGELNLLRWHNP